MMKKNATQPVPLKRLNQPVILLLLTALAWLTMNAGFAQPFQVTGTVTDALTQEPLPGVNILIEGTNTGAVTDLNGKYTVTVPNGNVKLQFSFIGYNAETIELQGKTILDVLMIPDIKSLDEVVVIGYGTVKKSDLTGAVSQIKPTAYKDEPVTQLAQVLQGRATGVMVSSISGAPGANSKIRIRGTNSIFGNNEPLYIVDGMTTDASNLNMNDIESFEILKDASATAIYGNRGANGVILITTKRGQKDKTRVDVDFIYGFDQIPPGRLIPTLGSVDYMTINNAVKTSLYTDEQIEDVRQNGPNTNWQDEIFRNGYTSNYQVGIGGGNEKTLYYISGNYIDQSGIVINTGYKKYTLRTNLETSLGKKVSFSLNSNISYKDVHNGAPADIQEALVWSPNLPVKDSTGAYTPVDWVGHQHGRNPVGSLMAQDSRWGTTFLNSRADLKWTILPGLTFNPVVGLDYSNFTDKYFHGSGRTGSLPESGLSNRYYATLQNSNILTYSKIFGKHELVATGVFEWIKYNSYGYGFSEESIPNDYFGYYKFGTGAKQNIPYSSYEESSLLSYLGRVNYNYNKKYYATASLRADASSKFRDENKWGYFPSVALSWMASNEQFMQSIDLIDQLKIRASYGSVGSQAIAPYGTQSLMGSGANFAYPYASPNINYGYGLEAYPNPALRWETTSSLNLGFDMALYKNRLTLSAEFFNKNTKDMLYPKQIPGYQGGGTIMTNVGTVNNKGFEFNIGGYPISNINFKWNTEVNLSYMKNTVTELADSVLTGPTFWGSIVIHRVLEGKPASSLYGLEFIGTWKEAEAAEATTFGAKPGMGKYKDQNTDGKIDDKDYVYAGSPYPDFFLGWNNHFTYKNWDLNIYIYASSGGVLFNHNYLMMNLNTVWSTTITHTDGQEYYDPVVRPNSDYPSDVDSEPYNSTRFIEDASYIRVKNISLTYTIARNWLKIADLKLGASVQNAFLITNYRGYEPEYLGGENDAWVGFDAGTYPTSRAFSFSVKATF